MSTWFNGVLRETRQGDIFEDKTATATLDNVESLFPRLPSEDCLEIDMNMMEAGGEGNLPTSELKFIMQRLEQTEQEKLALETKVGGVQRDIKEIKTKKEQEWYVQTWENNGKPESQNPIARVTAMLEKPKRIDAKQKSKDYLDAKVICGEANEDTYEKLGKFETALKNPSFYRKGSSIYRKFKRSVYLV